MRETTVADIPAVFDFSSNKIKKMFELMGSECSDEQIRRAMFSLVDSSFVEYDDNGIVAILAGTANQMIVTGEAVWSEMFFFVASRAKMSVPRMITQVEMLLEARGFKSMTLGVSVNSLRIKKMYKKLGYSFIDAHYIKRLK
jgi:hypothetical protein